MELGYPVVSYTLSEKGITPYREIPSDLSSAKEIYMKNLEDLQELLIWNDSQGIKFYRVSNHLAFDSRFESEEILSKMRSIGEFCREKGHRLSFHCSHYAVLCSPKGFIRSKAKKEIESLSSFFDNLGYEATHWNKINLHIGGAYGNKEKAMEDWLREWENLSDSAKKRLVVENDDKASMFSVHDLYEGVHLKSGVPITFDSFHHNFCNRGESKEEAASIAASTWKTAPACFHFASSRTLNEEKSNPTAHADWIYEEVIDWNNSAWIMVESSARDLAVLNYLKEGVGAPRKIEII
jgi:UV DNA damage endonuclease